MGWIDYDLLNNADLESRLVKQFCDNLLPEETVKTSLWTPYPGPQTMALETEASMFYLGGAAGGGKSDTLIGLAVEKHTKSHIFRRTYPQLTDLIERSKDIIGSAGKYNTQHKIWRFYNRRQRYIQFGSIEHENDKRNWQGRAGSFKGFDEAAEFSQTIIEFVTMWTRSGIIGQKQQVGLASNPPMSTEGMYLLEWFEAWLEPAHGKPAMPGELRWYIRPEKEYIEVEGNKPVKYKDKILYPLSRTFIPALVTDNPTYLHDEQYISRLQSAPEPMRSMLLYGDYKAALKDDAWQVIPTDWVNLAFDRWKRTQWPEESLSCVACDPNDGGEDDCVIGSRYGYYVPSITILTGKDTESGAKIAKAILREWEQGVKIHIDVMPSSPFDFLREYKASPLYGVNFGQSATYTDIAGKTQYLTDRSKTFRFGNRRAYMYWNLRELLDPHKGKPIALPPSKQLRQELCAHRFGIHTNIIQLEDKDTVKQRLGGTSPNIADMLVLLFSTSPDSGRRIYVPQQGSVDNNWFASADIAGIPENDWKIRRSK